MFEYTITVIWYAALILVGVSIYSNNTIEIIIVSSMAVLIKLLLEIKDKMK